MNCVCPQQPPLCCRVETDPGTTGKFWLLTQMQLIDILIHANTAVYFGMQVLLLVINASSMAISNREKPQMQRWSKI